MTKNWDDSTILTEAQLDDIKNSTETFLNTTKIDGDNIQTGGVPTAAIADLAVSSAKVAAGAITQAKRAALGQQLSSSSGTYTTASGSAGDVTNLSVSITTTGRPVFIGLVSDGTANLSIIANPSGSGNVFILKDAVELTRYQIESATVPSSSVWHIDTPAAGTYTYKIQALNTSGLTYVQYAKLIAYEL